MVAETFANLRTGLRWEMASETFANRDVGGSAYRDVLVACFRSHYPPQAPHQKKLLQTLSYKVNGPPRAFHQQRVNPQILLGALILIRYASFMREATDEQLMQRYAKGEAKAFDELYARHRGPLYRYFIRQVNNPATANDLYQGAWEKIIQARQKYRSTAPFTAWMYSIAHNHLIDYYRRLRPGDPLETDELSDSKPGPVQGVIEQEQSDQLRSGISALPQEQKNTLLLKLETGLKMEDIARVTGVSRETVKSRLRYAVNKLKRSLVE